MFKKIFKPIFLISGVLASVWKVLIKFHWHGQNTTTGSANSLCVTVISTPPSSMRIPKFTYFFSLLQGARWAGFRPPPTYVIQQEQYNDVSFILKYRVSHRLVLNFDFNSYFFWIFLVLEFFFSALKKFLNFWDFINIKVAPAPVFPL